MKQPINEIRRMQQLAGLITESQFNEIDMPPVNPITKEVMEDFENASLAIKKLKSSLENKEFTPNIHDPKKGIEVQRTKEEFIKEIEEIKSKLNYLSLEYGGVIPKGFKV